MLTQSNTILYDVYDRGEEQVTISVQIGNGQNAISELRQIDNSATLYNGSFPADIGINKDLKGKHISIITIIHDINPNDNKIYMHFEINGGKKTHSQVIIDSSLPSSGSFARAIIDIFFY